MGDWGTGGTGVTGAPSTESQRHSRVHGSWLLVARLQATSSFTRSSLPVLSFWHRKGVVAPIVLQSCNYDRGS